MHENIDIGWREERKGRRRVYYRRDFDKRITFERKGPSIFWSWTFSIPRPNLHANGVKFTLLEQDKCAYFLLHWHTLTMYGLWMWNLLAQTAAGFPVQRKTFLCSIFRSIISAKDKGKDVNNPFSIFSFVKKNRAQICTVQLLLHIFSKKDRKTDFSSVYGLAHNDIFCMVQKLVW